MRIEVQGQAGRKKDQLGLGLMALIGVMLAVAYILGSPAYATAFPQPLERALTNLRTEMDKASESLGYSISGFIDTVRSLASR
jgi:hypothetical protein